MQSKWKVWNLLHANSASYFSGLLAKSSKQMTHSLSASLLALYLRTTFCITSFTIEMRTDVIRADSADLSIREDDAGLFIWLAYAGLF